MLKAHVGRWWKYILFYSDILEVKIDSFMKMTVNVFECPTDALLPDMFL